jgi:hypothetical protein
MSLALSSIFLLIGGVSIGLSIWEAITAAHNDPKHTDYHGDMIQGYAFCIAKCVLNMILTFMLCGFIFCFGEPKENKKENKNNESILQTISLGVNIWGLVMYFNDYELGPFQNIVFAETIIFFVCLGILVLLVFGVCCFGICSLNIETSDNTTSYSNIQGIQGVQSLQKLQTNQTNQTNQTIEDKLNNI